MRCIPYFDSSSSFLFLSLILFVFCRCRCTSINFVLDYLFFGSISGFSGIKLKFSIVAGAMPSWSRTSRASETARVPGWAPRLLLRLPPGWPPCCPRLRLDLCQGNRSCLLTGVRMPAARTVRKVRAFVTRKYNWINWMPLKFFVVGGK